MIDNTIDIKKNLDRDCVEQIQRNDVRDLSSTLKLLTKTITTNIITECVPAVVTADAWMWEDGTAITWEDGSDILTENN